MSMLQLQLCTAPHTGTYTRLYNNQYRIQKYCLSTVKKYTHTINLPQTTFNLHSNPLQRESLLHNKLTAQLYRYQQSTRIPDNKFILHDGPPFANGVLHIGHYLNKTLKDIILRQQLQYNSARQIQYIPGWDCHGLPIEIKALEQIKLIHNQYNPDNNNTNNQSINNKLSSDDIRQLCREFAQSAIDNQSINFQQWCILGEWKTPYITMSPQYESAQLDIFNSMYNNGLIYRALKPVYWSPVSVTALAEAELEYNDKHLSPAIYTLFQCKSVGELNQLNIDSEIINNLSVLIWTTTPWTIPANVAIAYNQLFQYAIVCIAPHEQYTSSNDIQSTDNDTEQVQFKSIMTRLQQQSVPQHIIVGVDRIDALQSLLQRNITVLHKFDGTLLHDMICINPITGNNSILIEGSHVANDTGTCLVHTAPAHGHDDFNICKQYGIDELPLFVDEHGRYNTSAPTQLHTKYIFTSGNATVINMLLNNNSLLHLDKYIHRYPYDWRSKTPVIIRTTKQWFCRLDQLSQSALNVLSDVNTIPLHGKQRLMNTIGTRVEWCISRQRYWGLPIPVFYHKTTGDVLLNDMTIQHIKSLVSQYSSDCWYTMSERELLPSDIDSTQYIKGNDTLDVWFDSGSSWNAIQTDHGNNNELTRADIYLEGSDQHRGWFQSSLLTCVALYNQSPYKTLITHGFVLDHKYRKMSKSIGNVIDPNILINGCDAMKSSPGQAKQIQQPALGVDVLRLWVASVDYTNDVCIGNDTIKKVQLQLNKLRTTMKFIIGNINDFNVQTNSVSYNELLHIDQYMLHQLRQWQSDITQYYQQYNYRAIYSYISELQSTELSAFYMDICKDRLYIDSINGIQRRSSQTVLYYICDFLLKSVAAIIPYTSEEIYCALPMTLQQSLHYHTVYDTIYNSIFTAGWYNNSDSYIKSNNISYEYITMIKLIKHDTNKLIELCKSQHKLSIGSNVDVDVILHIPENTVLHNMLQHITNYELNTILLTSNTAVITVSDVNTVTRTCNHAIMDTYDIKLNDQSIQYNISIIEAKRNGCKCPRCWKYSTSTHNEYLCPRCESVLQ